MKRILFALMAFCALGILSCRKSGIDQTIKEYDNDQINNYMQQNGLTGMTRDTTGKSTGTDTTGIYYQIITPGTGAVVKDTSKISFVYTSKTLDGSYSSTDTIINHTNNYLAYLLPAGVRFGILNMLKRTGGKIRLLIPSRLAYGRNGTTINSYGTDGITLTSTPHAIAGNQCLDYTISLVSSRTPKHNPNYQAAYDSVSIKKYIATNNLTGYNPVTITTGDYKGTTYYYKVIQTGTGTDVVGDNSTVNLVYTGYLFNGTVVTQDNTSGVGSTYTSLYNVPFPGWELALQNLTAGAKISFIIPSVLGSGDAQTTNPVTGYPLPAFSCLRFDMGVISVTN